MSVAVLHRVLRERFAAGCDAAGIPPARRHYQGARFAFPDPMALCAEERLVEGAESVVAVSDAPVTEARGVYRVHVHAPANAGTADLYAAVDAIRDAFRPGAVLSTPTLFVEITGASPLALSEDDRRLEKPVEITWRARRAVPRS